ESAVGERVVERRELVVAEARGALQAKAPLRRRGAGIEGVVRVGGLEHERAVMPEVIVLVAGAVLELVVRRQYRSPILVEIVHRADRERAGAGVAIRGGELQQAAPAGAAHARALVGRERAIGRRE